MSPRGLAEIRFHWAKNANLVLMSHLSWFVDVWNEIRSIVRYLEKILKAKLAHPWSKNTFVIVSKVLFKTHLMFCLTKCNWKTTLLWKKLKLKANSYKTASSFWICCRVINFNLVPSMLEPDISLLFVSVHGSVRGKAVRHVPL